MIVADDTQGTNAGFNQELSEDTLDLCLTRLEIVTTDERLVLLSEFNTSRNKSILRSTIDERNTVKNTTDGENGRGSNFRMTLLYTLKKVISSIIDTRNDVCITFRIGSPNNDNFVQTMFSFECPDIIADMVDMSPFILSGDQI